MFFSARFIKISFFAFLLTLLFFLFTIEPVSAQAINPYTTPNTNPDVPKNLHNWTQNVMIEVMSAMTCQLAGVDPVNPNQKCLGVDQKTGKIGFVENGGGAIGVMGNMIAMTFTPPLHTGDYFNYLAQNFGIAKPAYAQGTGFQGLSPLMPIWSAFRNIVYLLFVLVFVLIGIAIMLRVKIDPRTVMTIENQIPKIIIGLILVTFSFAIVGFLIDFMWVFIYLIFNILGGISALPANSLNKIWAAQNSIQGNSPIGVFNDIIGFLDLTIKASGGISSVIIDLLGWSSIKNAFLIGGTISGIIQAIPFLIIAIAILWAMFRLWFTLIMAYVFILLDVIFAPFWIVAGLLPGSPISFSGWLRDLAANLIAFPAVIVMFLLGKILMDSFTDERVFVPPFIGNPNDANAISSLIGLGFILMTPNVVNMMKTAFKAPKINLAPIMQALGAGATIPTGVGKNLVTIGVAQRRGGWRGIAQYLATGQLPFPQEYRKVKKTGESGEQ